MLEASDTGGGRHLPIRDGDLVCLETDARELYSVILVREGRCWLRNLQNELDTVCSIHRCRRIGHESTALAGPYA
jgi:hypothetical protein